MESQTDHAGPKAPQSPKRSVRAGFTNALISRIPFLALIVTSTAGCPVPEPTTTGDIRGNAHYSGQSNSSGISVTCESTHGARSLTVSRMLSGAGVGARTIAAQATTDSSGAYTLTGLAEGTYTIFASSQNSLEKAVTTGVTVISGKTVTATDLKLTPTGEISGTAKLNGAANGNLGIVVFIAGTSYSAITDDSGAYKMSSVPTGMGYTLVASSSNAGYDSAITSVDVTAGATTAANPLNLPVHMVPATTGTVAGRALLGGATGTNAGIFVYLSGTSYITMTDDAGNFSIS